MGGGTIHSDGNPGQHQPTRIQNGTAEARTYSAQQEHYQCPETDRILD
ncbi:hypothetical protein [Aegicerativicinus sediminis]|nr:hypothetical protein [Aegicerativicinus sediminis]